MNPADRRGCRADILAAATVIVDDVALSRATGALAPATLRNVQPATFGQVLRGEHPGRSDDDEITVYAPVGLALAGPGRRLDRLPEGRRYRPRHRR